MIRDFLKGKPYKTRSSLWRNVRKNHLLKEPTCQWCHGTKNLEVHHIMPYHEFPELELLEENLITLCDISLWNRMLNAIGLGAPAGDQDHLNKGHLGSYKKYNPEIRNQCINKWRVK